LNDVPFSQKKPPSSPGLPEEFAQLPPAKNIVERLIRDSKEMLTFIRGVPWPAMRIFVTSALLMLFYRFFCAKKSFYRGTVRDYFDFNHNFFDLGHRAWMYISTFLVMFLLAVIISMFIDKNKPREVGLGLGDWRFGVRWSVIFLAVMLPITFAASYTEAFATKYPLAKASMNSFEAFFWWEFVSFLYFIGWEFFFRGYMLFSLYKYIGAIAVFVPMIPFVILHSAKPFPEAIGAIFVAELLCIFALRAGSFWYGMVVHWTINTAMDVFAIWQRGGFLD
jgi:CAAX protease family protein